MHFVSTLLSPVNTIVIPLPIELLRRKKIQAGCSSIKSLGHPLTLSFPPCIFSLYFPLFRGGFLFPSFYFFISLSHFVSFYAFFSACVYLILIFRFASFFLSLFSISLSFYSILLFPLPSLNFCFAVILCLFFCLL